ncbi:MAG: 2-oxo acid dehydrogenase subunit E2 [Holosporaceae bacterium]|nr:MAG: 2-oxo acid dehydrogenase subunit E2 [Holosporaceae bacterium]
MSTILGSGPHGRVVKADVENISTGPTRGMRTIQPSGPQYTDKPLTNMRRVIAQRLTESKQTVPHFYLTIECDIDALLTMRKSINTRTLKASKLR